MKTQVTNLQKLEKAKVRFIHIKGAIPVKDLVQRLSSGYSEGFALSNGVMQTT